VLHVHYNSDVVWTLGLPLGGPRCVNHRRSASRRVIFRKGENTSVSPGRAPAAEFHAATQRARRLSIFSPEARSHAESHPVPAIGLLSASFRALVSPQVGHSATYFSGSASILARSPEG
jgi:hypothetical protein